MKNIVLLFFSVFCFVVGFSQSKLSTPYETIYTHLHNLEDNNYYPQKAALAINPQLLKGENAINAAIKLKEILNGKGIYILYNKIPDETDYTDSTSKKQQYTLAIAEPGIYVEKVGNNWYYSQETIENIPKLYKEVFPLGTSIFSSILPDSIGNKKTFLLKNWQWLGIGLIILAGFFMRLLANYISKVLSKYIDKFALAKTADREKLIHEFLKALNLFLIIFVIRILVPSLQLAPKFSALLIKGFNILLIFLGAFVFRRLVFIGLDLVNKYTNRSKSRLDDQLLPIAKNLFTILIGLIAFSLALKQLNVNLTAIIAGVSIGGLAIALASQDTVKNFIGSITILFDHPFELGDYIILSGTEGTVEKVGMRATRIRTPNQSLAYIPNGDLSNMIIDNYGLRLYRRWDLTLGVEYGTSTAKIEDFCKRITQMLEELDYIADNRSLVRLNSLGSSSINIFCMIFIDVKTYNLELESKHNILLKIIDLANELGIGFAFPTQTLHLLNNKSEKTS
ncbi:MAG: mechanosensitive ion channel family protein [Chitinophagales bacterium]|nr:mechanosensitive ion channel family protein [Chitinophagales bacterium]